MEISSSENSEESENDEQIQENTSIDSLTGQGDEDDFIILPSSKKVKISKVKAKRFKIDYKNLQDSSKHDNENGMSTSTSTSTESLRPTSLSAAVLQTNLPPADTLTGSSSLSQPLCNHDKQPPDLQQLLPQSTTPEPKTEYVFSIPMDIEPEDQEEDVFTEINSTVQPLNTQFPQEYYTSDHSEDGDGHNYYIIEEEQLSLTDYSNQIPIVNYPGDKIWPEDEENGWKKIENDDIPDYCPFLGHQGINLDTESRNPEDFFNNLFDLQMFIIIAEATNNYVRKQITNIMQGRDPIEEMDHYSQTTYMIILMERCQH
ncbi:MAG: hypothetical protein MJE68_29485, partial [Proteobacteria bacterium]|nr:hypothetical protein [Pseudomonadota bacterium]